MNERSIVAYKKGSVHAERCSVKKHAVMILFFVVPWLLFHLTVNRIVGSRNPSNMAGVTVSSSMAAAAAVVMYFACLCNRVWRKDIRKVFHCIGYIAVAVLLWLASAESMKITPVIVNDLNRRLSNLNVEEFEDRCIGLLDKARSLEASEWRETREYGEVVEIVDAWLPKVPKDVMVFRRTQNDCEEHFVFVRWTAYMLEYGMIYMRQPTDEGPTNFWLHASVYPSAEEGIYLWVGLRR